jgi:DNA repair protein RadC
MTSDSGFQDAPLPGFEMPVPATDLPYIRDHRSRLRARFSEGGAAAMPDYELLELLLFRTIPRRNVKPLAHRLLTEFGDFNRVLAAAPERLARVPGAGAGVAQDLKIVEAAAHRMARARIMHRALDLNASAVILVHNHPSGDPLPSQADIEMTRRIIDAARTLEINVHDHLIIGRARQVSLRAEGLI